MLDVNKITQISNTVVTFFFTVLNSIENKNKTSFLETFVGFSYAIKSLSKAVEVVILTPEILKSIDDNLSEVIEQNLSEGNVSKLLKIMKKFKMEEGDVNASGK
jgi:uncharacterized protein YicC (UPF0701 family)